MARSMFGFASGLRVAFNVTAQSAPAILFAGPQSKVCRQPAGDRPGFVSWRAGAQASGSRERADQASPELEKMLRRLRFGGRLPPSAFKAAEGHHGSLLVN